MGSIKDLFKEEELKEKSDGNFQTICPDCGLQGGRTEGLVLFPETNTWYCHSSGKHGGVLELVAIQNKIIKCMDCCESGEKRTVLEGYLFKETLDVLRENYGEEVYESIQEIANLKKSIQLPNDGKLISTYAGELAKRIKKEYIFFYRPDTRQIVEIGKIKHPDGNFKYKGFITMNANRFVTLIERYFKPWANVYTKKETLIRTKSMPQTIANIVLVSDNFVDAMPVITRIFTIQQPIVFNGELTFPKLGYDERFGSWLSQDAVKITHPQMKLKEAKEILYKIYNGFCFKSEQDRINSIAALLTPSLKGLYSAFNVRDPVFFYRGNRERVGKDYNAGITGILYEGEPLEEPPISNNERGGNSSDEFRKKIMAAMMQGRKRFHSSNNKGLINNAVFEGVTTSRNYSDRILGRNEILTFDNEINFSLSGNIGTTLTPDLANRSIFINLFFDKEDANSRIFEVPDLHGWVKDNRGLILSALYCLMRNWIDKKCPEGSIPFTSYPEWAGICGGIMEAAGLGNPCKKVGVEMGISSDSETEEMKTLFELCFERKPEIWVKKSDIKNMLKESDEDIFGYYDWDKKSDQIKFGKKIDRFAGRVLSDIRFDCKDESMRASRREYRFVKEISDFDTKVVKSAKKDQKSGNVGNLGNVQTVVGNPLYYRKIKRGSAITTITHITKPKSDREVQFWEADECKDIIPNHTKEQVFEWIKQNPKYTFNQMYDKWGVGSLKFRNELLREGLI